MPQVPRYDSFQATPNAAPSGEQNIRLSPENFGAGIADALGQGGEQMFKFAEAERERADEISLLEAERKFQEWELTNVEAALNMRGKDAIAVPDKFFPDMDRALSDISGSIPSDRARLKFQERALSRTRGISLTINRHVRGEIDQYDAAETQAVITNSQRAAAMHYNDPERIAEEINLQHDAIRGRAERIGADAEVIEQLVAEATSNSHVAVLERMVSTEQYGAAAEYLAANADDLVPEQRAKVEKTVAEAGIRADSQDHADRIMRQHDTRTAALAAARDIEDPSRRAATVDLVNQRFNEIKVATEEEKKARFEDASQLVQDSGGNLNAVPPDMMTELTAVEIRDLKALGNFVRTGMPAQNDEKWYALTQMPDAEFAKLNLYAVARPYVDDARWNGLVARQKDIIAKQNGDQDATNRLTASRTFKQSFEDLARLTGIGSVTEPVGQWSEDERKEYINFLGIAEAELHAEEAALGRKMTPSEQRILIGDVLSRRLSVERDYWRDRHDVPYFELSGEELADAYVPYGEIPQGWQQSLTNRYLGKKFNGRSFESLSSAQQSEVKSAVGRAWAYHIIGVAPLDPAKHGQPPARPWRPQE